MATSSSATPRKEGKEFFNVQLISNDVRKPPFYVIPKITYKGDPSSVLSMIPPKVLIIQDVQCCYTCKVGEARDLEIRESYQKLCKNDVLKEDNKIIEQKGLTCALYFPQVLKMEWINIVLR